YGKPPRTRVPTAHTPIICLAERRTKTRRNTVDTLSTESDQAYMNRVPLAFGAVRNAAPMMYRHRVPSNRLCVAASFSRFEIDDTPASTNRIPATRLRC